jgi:hypothetical protein
MEDVWRKLENSFVKQDTFLHDLMQPVNTARVVLERDCKALEAHLDLLLHTFTHTKESCMMPCSGAARQQPEADVWEVAGE